MINKISKFFLVVILLSVICLIVYSYIIKSNIENQGKISVGKYVSFDSWGKGECNYFVFYINGKKYKANGGRAPKGFRKNLGKFYKIRYSEKFKGCINANFNEEVIDTKLILNAGFSNKDIINQVKILN